MGRLGVPSSSWNLCRISRIRRCILPSVSALPVWKGFWSFLVGNCDSNMDFDLAGPRWCSGTEIMSWGFCLFAFSHQPLITVFNERISKWLFFLSCDVAPRLARISQGG